MTTRGTDEIAGTSRPELGLLRIGDGPLALGKDGTARRLLTMLGAGARLSYVEIVGSDPVDVADALDRALLRAEPVVVWAAGEATADWAVAVCLAARARGREAVGLPPIASVERPYGRRVANLFWLCGEVDDLEERFRQALPEVEAAARQAINTARNRSTDCIGWTWPEEAAASEARRRLEEAHPEVLQRLVRGAGGARAAVDLELSAPSRTRLAQAKRLLRRVLAGSPARARPRSRVPDR